MNKESPIILASYSSKCLMSTNLISFDTILLHSYMYVVLLDATFNANRV